MFIFLSLKPIAVLPEEGPTLPALINYLEYHSHIVGTLSVSVQHANESINEYIKSTNGIQPHCLI